MELVMAKNGREVSDGSGRSDGSARRHNDEVLGIKGTKHSYFLRTKTPLLMSYDQDRFLLNLGSKSDHFDVSNEEQDLANCLVMLSNKSNVDHHHKDKDGHADECMEEKNTNNNIFQCKACKKIFNSHQALGGHRASHKKVKGCFAAKMDQVVAQSDEEEKAYSDPIQYDDQEYDANAGRKHPKLHECSVCRRVFSSGQALGGHKRCHWLTTSMDTAFIPNFHTFTVDITNNQHNHHQQHLDLNLNLPDPIGNQMRGADAEEKRRKIDNTMSFERGLTDLRDVNLDGGWLKVGIASSTD